MDPEGQWWKLNLESRIRTLELFLKQEGGTAPSEHDLQPLVLSKLRLDARGFDIEVEKKYRA